MTLCPSIALVNKLFNNSKKPPNLFSVLLNNVTKILAKIIHLELGLGLYILKIRCLLCALDYEFDVNTRINFKTTPDVTTSRSVAEWIVTRTLEPEGRSSRPAGGRRKKKLIYTCD